MHKIFISYRRDDAADVTGRINDRLRHHFGGEAIFTDVDSIPLGVDFREHLEGSVSQCDILLAVIGREWTSISDENGRRRLDLSTDFVRVEIESALKRKIPVVPLLAHGISMPDAEELPQSIRDLAFRNATPVRPDPDFHKDMDRLIRGIEKYFQKRDGAASSQPRSGERAVPVKPADDKATETAARTPDPAAQSDKAAADRSARSGQSSTGLRFIGFALAIIVSGVVGYAWYQWPTSAPAEPSAPPADQVPSAPEAKSSGQIPVTGVPPAEPVTVNPTNAGLSSRPSVVESLQNQPKTDIVPPALRPPKVVPKVEPPKLPTLDFKVEPESVVRGKSVTLTWNSAHAESVDGGAELGALDLSGSKRIRLNEDKVFKLAAKGKGGTTDSKLEVKVTDPPLWTNSLGMEFVRLEPATFNMLRNRYNNNGQYVGKLKRKVTLTRPFYIGKYEVTQAQWSKLLPNASRDRGDDLPVERVRYADAESFVEKLNALEGVSTYRLPTSAEWEYACYAGSSLAYGKGVDRKLGDDYLGKKPVGQREVNAWGIHDMNWNVQEWVSDWYSETLFEDEPVAVDPTGPATGKKRVARGGGSGFDPSQGRCIHPHLPYKPGYRSNLLGLRLVREIP